LPFIVWFSFIKGQLLIAFHEPCCPAESKFFFIVHRVRFTGKINDDDDDLDVRLILWTQWRRQLWDTGARAGLDLQ